MCEMSMQHQTQQDFLDIVQTILSCLVSIWGMLGSNVEVWMKNILYWFIEDSIHFGMTRGSKMGLALNEPK
jgi:hypothetical protein